MEKCFSERINARSQPAMYTSPMKKQTSVNTPANTIEIVRANHRKLALVILALTATTSGVASAGIGGFGLERAVPHIAGVGGFGLE